MISSAFARLWLGSTASGVATWALPFVLGYAASAGAISVVDLGIFLALRAIGFLLAVPFSGVFSDRLGARLVILISGLTAVSGTLLCYLGLTIDSAIAFSVFALGAILSGAGQGASRPPYQSIVPRIVPVGSLQPANAALSISVRATVLVGPAAATLIAAAWGVDKAVLVIAALWLGSATLPPWPEQREVDSGGDAAPGRQFVLDLAEGFHEARRHPWFFAALGVLTAVIACGYSVTNVLVPTISTSAYGNATLLVGTATAYVCGALIGAICLSRWRPKPRGWWALAGLGVYGLGPISLLMPNVFWIPITAYVVVGFGTELFNVIWFTAVQDGVEPNKLARVSAIDFIVSYGLAPLGLAAIAPLSLVLGIPAILIITAIICFAAAALASRVPTASDFRAKHLPPVP